MPICTPAAPSAKAAAMPRASVTPPAAITGSFTASTICGTSAKVPVCVDVVGVLGQEHAAVAARFDALRDDGVDAARFEPARLGRGRGRAQDRAPAALTRLHQARLRQAEVEAHDLRPGSSTTSQKAALNAARLLEGTGAAGSIPSSR